MTTSEGLSNIYTKSINKSQFLSMAKGAVSVDPSTTNKNQTNSFLPEDMQQGSSPSNDNISDHRSPSTLLFE